MFNYRDDDYRNGDMTIELTNPIQKIETKKRVCLPLLIGFIDKQKIAGKSKQKENEAKYSQIFVQVIVLQTEMIKHIVARGKGRINIQQ